MNDIGLCGECAQKVDRDLIRQRDWDYSVAAFGVPASQREKLRAEVVEKYGEPLEILASPEQKESSRASSRKRKRKRKRRR
ncbi:MAG: hypothetical protein QF886_08020 [Planctomycetota bacterium]|nr:hypothetical protein [Planctomycetota bacterium]